MLDKSFWKIYEELYSIIKDMYVIDIHNHLNPERLSPQSYEDIIFYHYIVTELVSAGMSFNRLEGLSGADKFKAVLPYIRYIRNTTTYSALIWMLRDLYGFDGKYIDEKNWRSVMKLIEEKVGDESRAIDILKNRVRVRKSFLTLSPLEKVPKYDRELFTGALRVDPLITNISPQNLAEFENMVGIEINKPDNIDEGLSNLFKYFKNHIVTVALGVNSDEVFLSKMVSKSEVYPYLLTLKKGLCLDNTGKNIFAAYVLNKVLEYCREYNLVFQLMIGVKRPVPGASYPDYAIIIFNPQQLLDISMLLSRYHDVKFDLIYADSLLNHPITVIVKNYSNAYVDGYWWYSMYPEIIRRYIRLRLQMLPYNKIGGFFSDAYVSDWVYGKALIIKKQIAYVLSQLIFEKYIDKDFAFDIAKALLSENAGKMYGIT